MSGPGAPHIALPSCRSCRIALAIAVAAWLHPGCEKPRQPGRLTIGVLADLPTPGGQPTVNAAELAVSQINESGGVTIAGREYRLELIVKDTENAPMRAMDAARSLAFRDKVIAIVGPNVSRNAIPVAAVAEKAGIPMISPGSTHPETTRNKPHVFRMPVIDSTQGRVMADFAVDRLRADKAAVMYDVSNPSTAAVADAFQRGFADRGGTVVASKTYVTGRRDFDRELRQIAEAHPQVLLLPNDTDVVVLQATRARALGIDAVFLGSDAWSPHRLEGIARLDGAYFCHHWHPVMAGTEPRSREFVDEYRARYGDQPAVMAALTYDAVHLLARTLGRSERADPDVIAERLRRLEPYQGITGEMVFHGDGDPQKSVAIFQFNNGTTELAMRSPRIAAKP